VPNQLNGTEHLIICLELLEDLRAQLLGEPDAAIAAIRRSGVMVPAAPIPASGDTFEGREAAAQAKIDLLSRRQIQRRAIDEAVAMVQGLVREISKAPTLSERLAAGL